MNFEMERSDTPRQGEMKRKLRTLPAIVALILASSTFSSTTGAQSNESGRKLSVLFLGDRGHHRPADRAKQLIPVLARRGIEIEYTEKVGDLNPQTLSKYDCLMVYANIGKISPDQEKALLDYVAGGKGFVPLHCASYCFLNSPKYIELVGAQFKSHKTGEFRTTIVESEHPILKGFAGFESWDETYVHHRHNEKDRVVLSYRKEGEATRLNYPGASLRTGPS